MQQAWVIVTLLTVKIHNDDLGGTSWSCLTIYGYVSRVY